MAMVLIIEGPQVLRQRLVVAKVIRTQGACPLGCKVGDQFLIKENGPVHPGRVRALGVEAAAAVLHHDGVPVLREVAGVGGDAGSGVVVRRATEDGGERPALSSWEKDVAREAHPVSHGRVDIEQDVDTRRLEHTHVATPVSLRPL